MPQLTIEQIFEIQDVSDHGEYRYSKTAGMSVIGFLLLKNQKDE
jgi:hypothetical protein